jgi:uncharacterized protein YbaA (DUF1428 family)
LLIWLDERFNHDGGRSVRYVDGFVLPVPKKNLQAYRRMAEKAGTIWREHGALEYRECAGDDLNVKGLVSFARTIKLKPGETVVFAGSCLNHEPIAIGSMQRS